MEGGIVLSRFLFKTKLDFSDKEESFGVRSNWSAVLFFRCGLYRGDECVAV